MDKRKFMEVLGGGTPGVTELPKQEAIELVRGQLEEADSHTYYDISGDGTRYVTIGVRHGVGFAKAVVEVLPSGLVQVVANAGQAVAPKNVKPLKKLLAHYSKSFKLPGLTVENGSLTFRSDPFDPSGRFDANRAVGLALSSVHAYAGVSLLLDAGVEAWELLDYGEDDDDRHGGGSDGDGGTPAEADEGLLARLRNLLSGLEDDELEDDELGGAGSDFDTLVGQLLGCA